MLRCVGIYLWSQLERQTTKLVAALDGELRRGDCGHGRLGVGGLAAGEHLGSLLAHGGALRITRGGWEGSGSLSLS